MLRINNTKVYGLEESIIASGYPFELNLPRDFDTNEIPCTNDFERIKKLGNAKSGSGHDSALKGIVVQFDLTAPLYIWKQFQRYHFHDIISSQSTMHRILEMDILEHCNDYVCMTTINQLKDIIKEYLWIKNNQENQLPGDKEKLNEAYMKIISNIPSGFELTARITSNFLQLKTIHNQRHNHKLEEWHIFCDWIESLDYFKELCLSHNNSLPENETMSEEKIREILKSHYESIANYPKQKEEAKKLFKELNDHINNEEK